MIALNKHAISSLSADGFAIIPNVVDPAEVAELAEHVAALSGQSMHALRNLLCVPKIRSLSDSPAVRMWIDPILGKAARPVRGIFFDKTPDANWKVAWHQDLSIAIKKRIDAPGFGPWSVKAGVQHVQPPVAVLENMVTIRLHLDDCRDDNGPLRVLPGSHVMGILNDAAIAGIRNKTAAVTCICPAGGAVLLRPLLLHASSQAVLPRHRRVVHIEYAGDRLPGGLEWAVESE